MVCAPSLIPREPGERVKTDRRDATKLVCPCVLVISQQRTYQRSKTKHSATWQCLVGG
jgi:hypothetical protein